jgi:hypothetical protein
MMNEESSLCFVNPSFTEQSIIFLNCLFGFLFYCRYSHLENPSVYIVAYSIIGRLSLLLSGVVHEWVNLVV